MSDPNGYQPNDFKVQKGFFQALFDLKFTEWVTLRVAGVLYLITIILVSLLGLFALFSLFTGFLGPGEIFVGFILIAAGWFLFVLSSRLIFEAAIATIAVAQNTSSLRK
jgi:hypothetical protein